MYVIDPTPAAGFEFQTPDGKTHKLPYLQHLRIPERRLLLKTMSTLSKKMKDNLEFGESLDNLDNVDFDVIEEMAAVPEALLNAYAPGVIDTLTDEQVQKLMEAWRAASEAAKTVTAEVTDLGK